MLNEKQFLAWMPEFLRKFFFFNHFSDLRSLMPFMNLQKKNVNGNQMRKMKFRLVLSLVCFYTLGIFFYCEMDMSADEPLLAWHCLYPNLLFPYIFIIIKVYRVT